MKKIILGSLVIVSCFADVTTVLPYVATINYDSSVNKSAKDKGMVSGVYASKGNMYYLVELDYAHTDISYKDSNESNLIQDDFTITYSKYYLKHMVKGGIHHISTSDTDLGDGDVLMAAVSGYHWKGYDKYSYGVEGYYSYYKDVSITQITPNFSYSKAININTRNNIGFKVNYIMADDYSTKDYTSFEVEDTLYYKKIFTTIKAYGGKMKTGVKDSGFTVYNSRDLLKTGYSLKVGYYAKKNLTLSASYSINTFEEDGKTEDGSNSVIVATLSYSF